MGWITSITYGALDGMGTDITGFDVTFGGDPLTDPHTFADAVAKVVLYEGKSRALRVRGTFPTDNSSYDFVKRFADAGGWYLIGLTDGQRIPLWDTWLAYRVIDLVDARWPVLRCNELIWHGVEGPEPLLPLPPPKLLLATDGLSPDGVWAWLTEAHGTWHILTERKRAFRKVVL